MTNALSLILAAPKRRAATLKRNAAVVLGNAGDPSEQEVRRLRRENGVLRQEQAFAKNVAVYFAKESR